MKTLLVGVLAEDLDQAAEIAARQFRTYLATSVKEALPLLDGTDLDGIVVGVHFNDGNVFEFLRTVRKHPKAGSLPIIVVKVAEGRLRTDSYRAIETACGHEGVAYIDAAHLVRALGTEVGYAELRRRIRQLLR